MNNGWMIIDKPLGKSSAQIVGNVKWLLNLKKQKIKIGHAGTLDPLATGVLPLAIGEATKVVQFLSDADKKYEFEVTWGSERSTDDAEGDVLQTSDKRPSQEEIEAILADFRGDVVQTPPQHSAIKVDGKRAYKEARDGRVVEIKPRNIKVHNFEITSHADRKTKFKVHCSKGTYIRSFARDMGRILECFGFVSELRRVGHGKFDVSHTLTLEKLEELCDKGGEQSAILPIEEALDDIPEMKLSDEEARNIRHGIALETDREDIDLILLTHSETLVAIAEIIEGKLKTRRVFNL